jgi:hypothetical protein
MNTASSSTISSRIRMRSSNTPARHAGEFEPAASNYPGIRYRVDGDAMSGIYRFIRSRISRHFPFLRGDMILWTYLSMATLQPEELTHRQRSCHTDPCSDPGRSCYAALVYLFENEDLGGTGFYRYNDEELMQEAKAIERRDPDQASAFLAEHFPTYRKPPRYTTESNEIAELICSIPARFNRFVFYPGAVPHSALITAPELLSKNFNAGRVTLNVFADVLPK